jgi:hypothetical protein
MDIMNQFDSTKGPTIFSLEEERQERVKQQLYEQAMRNGENEKVLKSMNLPNMMSSEQIEAQIRTFQQELQKKIE